MAEQFGPSYYAILTGPVLDNRELSASAKLLYASITSYTVQTGYCWAGNKALAERFGWGERTVSRCIAQLEDAGFIRHGMYFNQQTGKRVSPKVATPYIIKKKKKRGREKRSFPRPRIYGDDA